MCVPAARPIGERMHDSATRISCGGFLARLPPLPTSARKLPADTSASLPRRRQLPPLPPPHSRSTWCWTGGASRPQSPTTPATTARSWTLDPDVRIQDVRPIIEPGGRCSRSNTPLCVHKYKDTTHTGSRLRWCPALCPNRCPSVVALAPVVGPHGPVLLHRRRPNPHGAPASAAATPLPQKGSRCCHPRGGLV